MAGLFGHGDGDGDGGEYRCSDVHGPVDISTWTLHGRLINGEEPPPTPFLVGPVVGTVTDTTARILVELRYQHELTMSAFMDGEEVFSDTQVIERKTPTVFKLDGFSPGKRIRVVVRVGENGEEREARFTTTSDKTDWKIATVSCNCHSRMEKMALWERLARVVGDVDCVLHLGDQIYGDMDRVSKKDPSKSFHSAWVASNEHLADLTEEEEWETKRANILEEYRRIYRLTWNYPELAKVLASTANYMICDDHEVVDDLGDEEEHTDPTSKAFFIIKLAYQVYLEYQKQLLCDTDVLDMDNRVYYTHKLSPRVAFFMLDNRVERSIHRAEGSDEEWEDKQFLGPRQWEKLESAFEQEFDESEVVLFGSPTPIVFLSQNATRVASLFMDDARGTWGHPTFKSEQSRTLEVLSKWQSSAPNRAVVTLGGDVHVGGFTDSWHESEVPIHQMTASAIGNTPEGNIDDVKAAIMRHAMSIDQHQFPFKVEHHEWIYGPNFGMIDLTVGNSDARPDMTMTLIPFEGEPQVRNLSFGDESVDVESADQHGAATKAHDMANTMS